MRTLHIVFLFVTWLVVLGAGAIHIYAYTANSPLNYPWLDGAAKTLFLSYLIPSPTLGTKKKEATYLG